MPQTRPILANIERLHALMVRAGLEAVVVRSGVNFTYLSGIDYAGTLARHLDLADSPRGVFVIWPARGEPVLVLNRYAAPRAERDSWLETIVLFEDYDEPATDAVARAIGELGLERARLGFEKQVLSASHWEALGRALPDAENVDCTDLLHEVRWIKTPGEVTLIRDAARLLDEAYLEVLPGARPGQTEREVHAKVVEACLARGANWAHGILNSSRNSVVYGGESDFALQAGDILRNDYVLWYLGYPGHQSRTVVIGEPSPEQRRMYRTVRDIYRATIEMARPGVRADEVHRHASRLFTEAGLSGSVAIAGHSVGPWWHQQPPYLVPACDIVIEAGMVLAFEPHVNEFHLQDMVLIGDDGQENLSTLFDTDEMLVAG